MLHLVAPLLSLCLGDPAVCNPMQSASDNVLLRCASEKRTPIVGSHVTEAAHGDPEQRMHLSVKVESGQGLHLWMPTVNVH